jgi:tRNA nucleotidyltransferase (CCA-adding enzyme)
MQFNSILMNTYLVGGAVRDKLLNLPIIEKDWVVTGSTPEELLSKGFQQVGNHFPVFLHPQTHDEYALARTEVKYGHGYQGFNCQFSPDVTLEEDLLRRDLSINAMAMDEQGNIIDPYHGQEDLQHKRLRHVSPAFEEDPLRVLRVARFHAKLFHLGFFIVPETLNLMQKISLSGELNYLSAERIWKECCKALETKHPEIFFQSLRACQALSKIAPELDEQEFEPLPTHKGITIASENLFVLFCDSLSISSFQLLCKRIKVPKQVLEIGLKFLKIKQFIELGTQDAASIIQVFEQLDAFRQVHVFEQALTCCEITRLTTHQTKQNWLLAIDACKQIKLPKPLQESKNVLAIRDYFYQQRLLVISSFMV